MMLETVWKILPSLRPGFTTESTSVWINGALSESRALRRQLVNSNIEVEYVDVTATILQIHHFNRQRIIIPHPNDPNIESFIQAPTFAEEMDELEHGKELRGLNEVEDKELRGLDEIGDYEELDETEDHEGLEGLDKFKDKEFR